MLSSCCKTWVNIQSLASMRKYKTSLTLPSAWFTWFAIPKKKMSLCAGKCTHRVKPGKMCKWSQGEKFASGAKRRKTCTPYQARENVQPVPSAGKRAHCVKSGKCAIGVKRGNVYPVPNEQPVPSAAKRAHRIKPGEMCIRCQAREKGTRVLVLLFFNRNCSVWSDWLVDVFLSQLQIELEWYHQAIYLFIQFSCSTKLIILGYIS